MMKLFFLLLLFGSVFADELRFYDRAVFLQEGQRSERSFTGLVVKKQKVFYLVVCKHTIDPKINRWLICLPNQPYLPLTIDAEWIHHPEADLSILPDLALESAGNYAIDYSQLAAEVPAKLTQVVVSGYPNNLVTKPIVSPVVRKSSVSSIETRSKNESGDLIPVYFLNDFSGPGSSGSPVFDYSDRNKSQPQVVGILSGGWNSRVNTGSVVTPAYYLKELIEIAESTKGEKKK